VNAYNLLGSYKALGKGCNRIKNMKKVSYEFLKLQVFKVIAAEFVNMKKI